MSGLRVDSVPDSVSFRFQLKEVSDMLSRRDLAIVKFSCADIIPTSELEMLNDGLSVWTSLETKSYLSPTDYTLLEEVLYLAGRIDLLRKLGKSDKKVANRIKRGDTKLSKFRILLCKFAAEISAKELDAIKYIFQEDLSTSAREEADDVWKFFLLLEKNDLLTPTDICCLEKIIRIVDKPGLQRLIDDYSRPSDSKKERYYEPKLYLPPIQAVQSSDLGINEFLTHSDTRSCSESSQFSASYEFGYGQRPQHDEYQQMTLAKTQDTVTSKPYTSPDYSTALSSASVADIHHQEQINETDMATLNLRCAIQSSGNTPASQSKTSHTSHMEGLICHPSDEPSVDKSKSNLQFEASSFRAVDGHVTASSAPHKTPHIRQSHDISELPAYKMTADPKGPCIIINNEEFTYDPTSKQCKKLQNRPGSRVDRDKLKDCFQKLGLEVTVHDNCTVEQMDQMFKELASDRERMAKSDVLAVIILSHGKCGAVYGSDGYVLKIAQITQHFRASNCPGLMDKPKLFFLQACQGKEKQQVPSKIQADGAQEAEDDTKPDDADFFIGYATIPGFVSFRHEDEGSWYINALVENLTKYAAKADLLSIMTEVNRCVAKRAAIEDDKTYKQLPLPYTTLTKKVCFL